MSKHAKRNLDGFRMRFLFGAKNIKQMLLQQKYGDISKKIKKNIQIQD